ncbi:MAG: HNH endonuclease, partial [Thaumarchaeota archaeon]|nr:HNH endonuclease [Nitrososphaerota archaeon]
GLTNWENIVTACFPCNDKKGARTPEEASMKLLRRPSRPKTLPLDRPVLSFKNIPEEWHPWVEQDA